MKISIIPKFLILLLICFVLSFKSIAQIAKTQVIQTQVQVNNASITINWKALTFSGNYFIRKRINLSDNNWGSTIATLPSTATSFTDTAIKKGKAAEYQIIASNGSSAIALGYVYAGNEFTEVLSRGGILLLIDSNYLTPLSSSILRLKRDLTLEGWDVAITYAGRQQTPINVKKNIINQVANAGFKINTMFIIGHVPVPYSGDFSNNGSVFPPDGHVEGSGNHTGAWPADVYYADLDTFWTDLFADIVTGADNRNHNVPGDGKFDQAKLSTDAELEVGRVDLFNMPLFGLSDTILVKNYLDRNHAWRTGNVIARKQALIDNNFPGLNLASTAYHNFSTFFNTDSIFDNLDFITEQSNSSFLWSFGCGAGSYTSCAGIGNTSSFVNTTIKNVFTILSGSFFGDWDVKNNFLKAPLCNQSLASFWGGIPKWYIHTMGLGKHIGYGTKISQNNTNFYFNGSFNLSDNSVHIALMGDPTLMNAHLPQVTGLNATSNLNKVFLSWNKAKDGYGYCVYRINKSNGYVFKLACLIDTFYTDNINFVSGIYDYTVRITELEQTGSGSYFNVGGGEKVSVNHLNSVKEIVPLKSNVYPNPTNSNLNILSDYEIRKILILDLQGRIISIYETKTIDVTHLKFGLYQLMIEYKDGLKETHKVQITN